MLDQSLEINELKMRKLNAKQEKKPSPFIHLDNFPLFTTRDAIEKAKIIAEKIRENVHEQQKIAFISGNFNVVHPGHFRLLNFAAECADVLIIGINNDEHPGVHVHQALRLESVRSIGCVDMAFLLPVSAEKFILYLKPDIVIKGKEHENLFNPEQLVLDSYGGKLVFSAGEMRFSSLDLLKKELQEINLSTIKKPNDYLNRHQIDEKKLVDIIHSFSNLSVVVLGDLIVDEYLTCDPLGISREDPTIVVTPIKKDSFLGGAGIVAAHARSLGAKVNYFSIAGQDEAAIFASNILEKYEVTSSLLTDPSRPTTLKQRFRAEGKTLLRVSHLRHHDIGNELVEQLYQQLIEVVKNADLVIFSDFNYGCLPQSLVDQMVDFCQKNHIPMVADSQSSSQIGDVSRFHGMLLITPTEHEARLAVRDQGTSLIMLADTLSKRTNAQHVFVTLGAEGLLIHSPGSISSLSTDQLPAFNSMPKDVSGGGDCLLTSSSLALVAGANIWESAYLGSIAAACHVGRIGNLPLGKNEILQELLA